MVAHDLLLIASPLAVNQEILDEPKPRKKRGKKKHTHKSEFSVCVSQSISFDCERNWCNRKVRPRRNVEKFQKSFLASTK